MSSIKIFSVIFCLTVFAGLSSFAQSHKTDNLSDDSKLSYTLNEAKKLDGPYRITRSGEDKTTLRGSYRDGARIGNWYAFNDDGNVFLRYNYDQKKLVYLDTTSIKRLNVEVLTGDKNTQEKATIPVPITSIDEYISLLGTEFKRRLLVDNKNASGALTVDFITRVDKNGRPNYEAAYTVDGILVSKKLVISEKNFDLEWIPASYEGTNFPSIFTVRTTINLSEKDPGKQRFIWAY